MLWGEFKKWEDIDGKKQWSQRDVASHAANVTMAWLGEKFWQRLISRKAEVKWAPHLFGLNPSEFFLYVFLKGKIYQDHPCTIAFFKAVITANIQAITQKDVKVLSKTIHHLQKCFRLNSRYLESVL